MQAAAKAFGYAAKMPMVSINRTITHNYYTICVIVLKDLMKNLRRWKAFNH
jgi:hypothetical protein